jgi:hypothetical protein
MTKAELQKHGEKLAWKIDMEIGGTLHLPAYQIGFNQALELLFPLVGSLEAIKDYMYAESISKNSIYRINNLDVQRLHAAEEKCKEALAELEKKVRGA